MAQNTGRESGLQNAQQKTAQAARRTEARREDRANGTLAFPNRVTMADRILRRGRGA